MNFKITYNERSLNADYVFNTHEKYLNNLITHKQLTELLSINGCFIHPTELINFSIEVYKYINSTIVIKSICNMKDVNIETVWLGDSIQLELYINMHDGIDACAFAERFLIREWYLSNYPIQCRISDFFYRLIR